MEIHNNLVFQIQWQFIKNISLLNPNKCIINRIKLQNILNLLLQTGGYIHLIAKLIHNCNILFESCFLNAYKLKHTCEHSDEITVEGDSEEHIEDGDDLLVFGHGADVAVTDCAQGGQSVVDAKQVQMEISAVYN